MALRGRNEDASDNDKMEKRPSGILAWQLAEITKDKGGKRNWRVLLAVRPQPGCPTDANS